MHSNISVREPQGSGLAQCDDAQTPASVLLVNRVTAACRSEDGTLDDQHSDGEADFQQLFTRRPLIVTATGPNDEQS